MAQWQPESEGKSDDQRLGGLDAAQVLGLDILLLRHAVVTGRTDIHSTGWDIHVRYGGYR
eukprot:6909041-Ditylum_brightwellii.AAC.1